MQRRKHATTRKTARTIAALTRKVSQCSKEPDYDERTHRKLQHFIARHLSALYRAGLSAEEIGQLKLYA